MKRTSREQLEQAVKFGRHRQKSVETEP
jgi:hypothetical protein